MSPFWVLSAVAVLLSVPCRGEPQEFQVPQNLGWISGGNIANLGKVATFNIPIGWQFLEEQDAQVAVQQLLNEKSRRKGMLGALAPEGAGNYWVIFEYTETGYAPETAKDINAAAILKIFRDRMQTKNAARVKNGESQVTSIDWEMTPSYDPADHTLEWAVRAESLAAQSSKGTQGAADKGPVKTVNQTLRFLGRHGMMDAIVVRRDPGFVDRAPIKELVKGFAFRAGERYENYQAGDKMFAGGFTDLIASESDAERSADLADGTDTAKASYMGLLWIGLGGLAGLATVGILVATVLRRRGHQEYRPATPPEPALGVAAPSQPASAEEPALVAQASGAREVAQAVTAQLALAGLKAKAKAEATPVVAQQKRPLPSRPAPSRPAANHRSQVNQRRKMFDYNRYFTDLMSTVSHYATSPDSQTINGYSLELGKPTGETAPTTNGNGHAPPSPTPHSGSDLIAHQASFIEEQRRLIQEQSRLIEEKSKLIAEKNQLLKLQSELIDNKLL